MNGLVAGEEMKKMTVKLFIEDIEALSYNFQVHDQYLTYVKVMVKEKLQEIVKDFNIQSPTPTARSEE